MTDDEETDLTVAYLWGKAEGNDDIRKLQTEIKRLREALRFYACECSGVEACETFGNYERSGCGHKARTALGENK